MQLELDPGEDGVFGERPSTTNNTIHTVLFLGQLQVDQVDLRHPNPPTLGFWLVPPVPAVMEVRQTYARTWTLIQTRVTPV